MFDDHLELESNGCRTCEYAVARNCYEKDEKRFYKIEINIFTLYTYTYIQFGNKQCTSFCALREKINETNRQWPFAMVAMLTILIII